jgi:hypothetical protein
VTGIEFLLATSFPFKHLEEIIYEIESVSLSFKKIKTT